LGHGKRNFFFLSMQILGLKDTSNFSTLSVFSYVEYNLQKYFNIFLSKK
jgi:hypothetical protein